MKEMLSQGLFALIIQSIIILSVFGVFLAIFIDFALYSGRKQVRKEKKSIVETGTMTLFFAVYYLILRTGVGVISVKGSFIKGLLIVLGTVMILSGCIANISGRLHLGRNWANQIRIYQEQTLVQTGIYRLIRHPLYASIILMLYGGCMVYRNLYCFIAVTAIFVPFMVYRARQEEKLLTQIFPQYDEYKRCTGMLFPKIFK
jgi:protein-S-isoprenylcysteine O-methyltransferase Ste14